MSPPMRMDFGLAGYRGFATGAAFTTFLAGAFFAGMMIVC
jgi:hypothetical protein